MASLGPVALLVPDPAQIGASRQRHCLQCGMVWPSTGSLIGPVAIGPIWAALASRSHTQAWACCPPAEKLPIQPCRSPAHVACPGTEPRAPRPPATPAHGELAPLRKTAAHPIVGVSRRRAMAPRQTLSPATPQRPLAQPAPSAQRSGLLPCRLMASLDIRRRIQRLSFRANRPHRGVGVRPLLRSGERR